MAKLLEDEVIQHFEDEYSAVNLTGIFSDIREWKEELDSSAFFEDEIRSATLDTVIDIIVDNCYQGE